MLLYFRERIILNTDKNKKPSDKKPGFYRTFKIALMFVTSLCEKKNKIKYMIGSFSISVSITSRIESKLFNTGVCRVAREQPNNIFTLFTAEKSGEKKDTANV